MTWTYSKLKGAIWREKRFRSLSPEGRNLLLYFMLNEHQVGIGCYRLPDGYALADTGFDLQTYQHLRGDLVEAGLILFDDDSSEIFITEWFTHNPPMNDRHAKGCRKEIMDIESDNLRLAVEEAFLRAEEARPADQPKKPRREDIARLVNSAASNLDQRRKDPFSRF